MKWIKAEDKLPELDTPVLAILSPWGHIVPMARVDEGDGWLWCHWNGLGGMQDKREYECDDDYFVTHWMLLPELPSEEMRTEKTP